MVGFKRFLAIGAMAALLAGCNTTSGDDGSGGVGDFFSFGGSSGSSAVGEPSPDTYCPRVDVAEGGASISAGGGQAVLRRFARECLLMPDGTVTVKVGVMGLVLSGPNGRVGGFSVPVRVVLKDGEKILAQRAKTASSTPLPGAAQGEFTVVEENLVVPAEHINSFEIEVSLGGAVGSKRRRGG